MTTTMSAGTQTKTQELVDPKITSLNNREHEETTVFSVSKDKSLILQQDIYKGH